MKKHVTRSIVRFIHVWLLLTSIFLLTSCASQKAWKYGAEPEASTAPLINRTVSTPPFLDNRPNENTNAAMMYLIPVMPMGWQNLDTPEGVQMHMTSGLWQWKPNEDIAKATAEELRNAHIFKETFFTNRPSEGDIVLQGAVDSTKYNSTILSYGLSAYGPALWLVGLPCGSTDNELALTFKLKDKNNVVLWEKTYREQTGSTSWIYVMRSDFEYPALLKKILLNVVNDLKSNSSAITGKL